MADGRMWSTPDNARWFFVPASVTLPEGELEIRDLLGRRRQVDRAAIGLYEVQGDAARTLVRRQILDLLAKVDAGLASLRSLMPEDRPEGAQGLEAMRQTLAGLLARLRTPDDPPPQTWRPDDLAARFEGWLRGVAADPKGADDLRHFADDLQAMARQLQPTTQVVSAPAAPPRTPPARKGPPKKKAPAEKGATRKAAAKATGPAAPARDDPEA